MLLIRDLAVVMVIAGGAGWLCRRWGLSAVVGYLAAGAIIGPFTPPFALVTDTERIQTLAQLGLVFLIFSIGLNLSLSRLRRLGLSVVVATALGALLVLNGCRLFGWALGWTGLASLFLAGMLMVSSSAIIGKVLAELNLTHERPGQLALGITVLEDVVAVVMLTLLTSLLQLGAAQAAAVVPTLGALGAFVVLLGLLSLLVAPNLLLRLRQTAPLEIRTLLVAGLLLTLAWLSVRAGYSLALGAFVFGAVVGGTRFKADIERTFEGFQQVFGAVFFVAVGMQVDFKLLLTAWPLVLAVTVLALMLRPLACAVGLVAVGNTSREALMAGLTLTPLGEFSFIIAQLGVSSGVLPPTAFPVAVGASLLTSLAAPLLSRHAEALSRRVERAEPRRLQAWIAFYHEWLMRLRHRLPAGLLWRLTRARLLQVAVQVAFVSALIVVATPIHEHARATLGADWPFPHGTGFLFWSVFGVLLLAPLIAIWRNVSALAMILAESATSGAPRQTRLRPLLEAALRSVALVMLAVWLLALLPSGWSLLQAAGGVLALVSGIAAVFWRRFVRWHSRLEIELLEQLKRARHATGTSAWPAGLPAQSAPWDLDIEEVTLPSDTALAGKTVRELGLRQRFGCSLIGIDRHGYALVNPSADTALFPQDKLLLLGTPVQLAKAGRECGRSSGATDDLAGFADLTMESVEVPVDSPLAGRTLIELDLIRRAGVQIGAIRRGSQRLPALSGQDQIEVGDVLLVLGTHTQNKTFRTLLSPEPLNPPAGEAS